MTWFDKMGIWMMQHPMMCLLLLVLFTALYVWLIYIEEKWR